MGEFIASGRVVDLILGLMLLEGIFLTVHHRRTSRGIAPGDLVGILLAGGFLLLALRAALMGTSWFCIAGCLVGALLAHLFDLARRWRGD